MFFYSNSFRSYTIKTAIFKSNNDKLRQVRRRVIISTKLQDFFSRGRHCQSLDHQKWPEGHALKFVIKVRVLTLCVRVDQQQEPKGLAPVLQPEVVVLLTLSQG